VIGIASSNASPHLRHLEQRRRHALARDPAVADQLGRHPRVVDRLELFHRDDQGERRILGRARRQLALDRPREQPIVRRRRRARVREAKQIAIRPAIARLVLGELVREIRGRLAVEPRADRLAHAAAPATEALGVGRELHQVGADPAHLGQRGIRGASGGVVAELGRHREREDRRVALGGATGLGDRDDAIDRAHAIGGEAARDDSGGVARQGALADVERAAIAAQDQEAIEAVPVGELPREATGRLRDRACTGERWMRWGRLGRKILGELEHDISPAHGVDGTTSLPPGLTRATAAMCIHGGRSRAGEPWGPSGSRRTHASAG
jgi:hypothetical protein